MFRKSKMVKNPRIKGLTNGVNPAIFKTAIFSIAWFLLPITIFAEVDVASTTLNASATSTIQAATSSVPKSPEDLRSEIKEKNSQITEIEKEIEDFRKDIEQTEWQARTFKGEINVITSTVNKLSSDIRLTRKRIEVTELTLEELTIEIEGKEDEIKSFKQSLAELIRNVYELESYSLVEILLAHPSLSVFFNNLEYIEDLGAGIKIRLADLRDVKSGLEEEKNEREQKRRELVNLRQELGDRKIIEEHTRGQKRILLDITRSQEARYKELLEDRLTKKEALEIEIRKIEEELHIVIDPESLPKTGTGILSWPLPDVSLDSCFKKGSNAKNCITQFFGNTSFATQNAQIYNGRGHNGIDFRASVGTPVRSSFEGVVTATGDTDRGCRGVSYGKWVLVEHSNSLSTLYTHLSLIKTVTGSSVNQEDIIGYSGNTGYTTGPHLHYAVFATEGIQVTNNFRSRICGTTMRLPLASYSSYLNPLSYLKPE